MEASGSEGNTTSNGDTPLPSTHPLAGRQLSSDAATEDGGSSGNNGSNNSRSEPQHLQAQSQHSRSSGRSSSRSSRSPHRHRHHHRRRRSYFKEKERNFLAAVCSMIVIVTLCTALAEPNWFYLRGGGCRSDDENKSPVHTLGVYQFFYMGHFENAISPKPLLIYHYSADSDDVLVNCVTPRVVQVMRSIIALCFVGVMFSLMAFFLDLAGPSDRMMKILRRNAVFNILTVIVCVTVNGFSFLITQLLNSLQAQTRPHDNSKIDVRFDVSFYLVAAAGGMSVIAAAFNLLRRYPQDHGNPEQRESLLDDYEGMDSMHAVTSGPELYAHLNYMPPPPAYSP